MPKLYDQVILFGDSLFERSIEIQDGFSLHAALQASKQDIMLPNQTLWIGLILSDAAVCARRLDVINRGFSGWNSRNALQCIPHMFLPPSDTVPRIKYFVVLLGANDACEQIPTNTQGIPLDEYKLNLERIITHPNITAHNPKVLLVTPPPLDQIKLWELDQEIGHQSPTRTAKRSALYSQAAREVAAKNPGTVSVDLHKMLMDKALSMTDKLADADYEDGKPLLGHEGHPRGGLANLLPDGLHMSGEAYRTFFEAIKGHIGPFPEDDKDWVFPSWRTLNPGSL